MQKTIGLLKLMGAAAAAALLLACPEGGTGSATCTTDADCQGAELCHPTARVCVETCTAGADCPSHARTCAEISTSDSRMICQCATSALCQSGPLGVDGVCADEWKICMNACQTNTDCPTGFDCEATTGQCKAAAATACTPACDIHQTCDTSGATPTCVAIACSASAQQPDACPYGAFCASNACSKVPEATCSNFTNLVLPGTWDPRTWDPKNEAHTGPVIYSIAKTTADATFCTAGTAPDNVRAQVKVYRTEGEFPTAKEANAGFFYVRVNGSTQDATLLVRPSGYVRSADGKHAEFMVNFCIPAADSQVQVGLFFTNGNAACSTLQK